MRWRRPRVPDLRRLIDEHLGEGDPTGWFEPLYAAAFPHPDLLVWHRDGPHPYLVDWLANGGPGGSPVRAEGRAVVVGCGLGDDAAALAAAGFEVTAFDVAPTAITWAKSRHAQVDVDWRVADLLDLPEDLRGCASLVVEVHVVDHLPGVVRDAAMQAVGALVAPAGSAVAVTTLAASYEHADHAAGPPWPQSPSELTAYRAGGLLRHTLEHPEPDEQGLMEVRIVLGRTPARPG